MMRQRAADASGTIGFFDSGLGGLSVLQSVRAALPDLSTTYLGDNARAPYGALDHETIFRYTQDGLRFLLDGGCPLAIVACNTASAQALRRVQREILPAEFPGRRVLGVIRPSAEALAGLSGNGHIGIAATPATAASGAYGRECRAVRSEALVTEVGVPELVPLVESGMAGGREVESAVQTAAENLLTRDPRIDTVLLGCTHFPLVEPFFRRALPDGVRVVVQGPIVAEALADYLLRHPEIGRLISRSGSRRHFCTGDPARVTELAARFTRDNPIFEPATLSTTPYPLPPNY